MLRRKACGKISRLAIAAATVRPENSTVRPAVARVRRIAIAGGVGLVVGQRGELLAEAADHEERVVDRQADADQRDHVDGEDRDLGERA